MDERTRRVAYEIIEAGLSKVGGHHGDTWDALNLKFLAVADALAHIIIGDFARRQSSVQESSEEAAELREKVAADLHKTAASLVTLGVKAAVMALQLGGKGESEAIATASEAIRSDLAEDGLPDVPADELLASAHRNYVIAAAELYGLNHESDQGKVESFALGLLADVVGFAVAAAASARAMESV